MEEALLALAQGSPKLLLGRRDRIRIWSLPILAVTLLFGTHVMLGDRLFPLLPPLPPKPRYMYPMRDYIALTWNLVHIAWTSLWAIGFTATFFIVRSWLLRRGIKRGLIRLLELKPKLHKAKIRLFLVASRRGWRERPWFAAAASTFPPGEMPPLPLVVTQHQKSFTSYISHIFSVLKHKGLAIQHHMLLQRGNQREWTEIQGDLNILEKKIFQELKRFALPRLPSTSQNNRGLSRIAIEWLAREAEATTVNKQKRLKWIINLTDLAVLFVVVVALVFLPMVTLGKITARMEISLWLHRELGIYLLLSLLWLSISILSRIQDRVSEAEAAVAWRALRPHLHPTGQAMLLCLFSIRGYDLHHGLILGAIQEEKIIPLFSHLYNREAAIRCAVRAAKAWQERQGEAGLKMATIFMKRPRDSGPSIIEEFRMLPQGTGDIEEALEAAVPKRKA